MKNCLFILTLLMVAITPTFITAQSSGDSLLDLLKKKSASNAFADLDAYLTKNNLEFDNDEQTVKLFNEERVRLGANFETEVWKYLGDSLAKHYWISSFIDDDYYSQGNKPLPELAYRIREKGVEIPVANDDYPGLGNRFTMLRDMVVYLYLDGKRDSAIAKKRKAEKLYKEIKDYGVVGATDEYTWCIYENLEKNPEQCKKEDKENAGESLALKQCDLDSTIYSSFTEIRFMSGSTALSDESQHQLSGTIEYLKKLPALCKFEIGIHSDNLGNSALNKKLSQKRADTIKAYLTNLGISSERIEAIGYGDSKPIFDNSTAKGREQNRRIELKVFEKKLA